MNEPDRDPRRAVYTALFGEYESLKEQPVAAKSGVEFICFTDDPALSSDTWRIEVVQPLLPHDMVRSARSIKIRGDDRLEPYDETLWIDNRVELKTDPALFLDVLLHEGDVDMGLVEHGFHKTLAEEFAAVADGGYDDVARVSEQLFAYAGRGDNLLDVKPLWTGVMARRRSPAVVAAMSMWMDHVLRYSRRDQLSLPVVLADSALDVRRLRENNRESEWHRWPRIPRSEQARRARHTTAIEQTVRMPLMRLASAERAAAEARDRLDAISAERARERDEAALERDAATAAHEIEVRGLRSRVAELEHALRTAREGADAQVHLLDHEREESARLLIDIKDELAKAQDALQQLRNSRAVRTATGVRRFLTR